MATSEIIATYALGLAILEFLRWGGFKGMTYTLPVFIEGSINIGESLSTFNELSSSQ